MTNQWRKKAKSTEITVNESRKELGMRSVGLWCVGVACVGMLAGCASIRQAGGKNDVGLVAHYSFDQDANDVWGHGNDGQAHGAVHAPQGRLGGAYSFDGVGQSVHVPQSSTLNATSSVTICAWICPRSTGGFHPVLDKEWGNKGYNLYVLDHQLHMRIDSTVAQSGLIQTGKWSHVAGVYDGKSISLYLDGKGIGNRTAGSLRVWDKDLYIGGCGDDTNRFMDGLIDEVYIFNRALSADEVQSIFKLK